MPELQGEAVTVDGQFEMELGRFALDVPDDHVDPVPVLFIVLVGAGTIGAEVAVAVDVAHQPDVRRAAGRGS